MTSTQKSRKALITQVLETLKTNSFQPTQIQIEIIFHLIQAIKLSQHTHRKTKLNAYKLIRKEIQKQIHYIIWKPHSR